MRLPGTVASFIFLLWLCGCGGSSSNPIPNPNAPQFTIASGDWSLPLLRSVSPPSLFFAGGFLTQSGAALSGTLHIIAFPCLDPFTDDLPVTGTVSGDTVTISTTPLRGQVLTLSLHPSPGQSGDVVAMEGSGNLTGPCAVSGTITASLVPPINGVFKGTFNNNITGDLTANLNQSGPDVRGFFHVSGNVTLSGSPCFTSATIADSTIFGGTAFIDLDTDSGTATLVADHVVSATVPEELISTLLINSGPCANQSGLVFLKKQ
ncbi:MAG TPA: hypothetical protein VI685_12850 [Candidatus Angelobacter sp.]